MKYDATVTITGEGSAIIFDAFKPENNKDKDRSELKVIAKEKKVIFEISASDATAFRATINSLTKMLSVVEKTRNI